MEWTSVDCSVCPTVVVVVNGNSFIAVNGVNGAVEVHGCSELDGLPPAVVANVSRMLGCGDGPRGFLRFDEIRKIREELIGVIPAELVDEVLFYTSRANVFYMLKKRVVSYAVANCLGNRYVMNALSRVSLVLYKSKRVGIVDVPYTAEQRDEFCIRKLRSMGVDEEEFREIRKKVRNPPVAAALACAEKYGAARCAEAFGVTEQELRMVRRNVLKRRGGGVHAKDS